MAAQQVQSLLPTISLQNTIQQLQVIRLQLDLVAAMVALVVDFPCK
jgi:hypothetical protein